ncbi:MAG: type I restriction enzyme HsdR N-terminal domain-containing protein [Rikenellaceae bacterium]
MPKPYPKLNFPPIKLRAQRQKDSDTLMVWSSVRSCYLVLTPEEWVRRHLVEYLLNEHSTPPAQIIEEYPVLLNGQNQRADIVVVDGNRPLLLAECKAPDINLSQETLSQAVRYNSVVNARYIVLTNGVKHLCFERTPQGEYLPLRSFPDLWR